jgi:hypothetical protein
MNFNNYIYIDPTIGTAGDGSSPSAALKSFSDASTLVNDTMYIIRRTNSELAIDIPSGENTNIKRIGFVGMPLKDDALFLAMPKVAQDAWGNDTESKAQLKVGSFNLVLQSCYDFLLYNINLEKTANYTDYNHGYSGAFVLTNTTNYCNEIGGKTSENNTYYGTLSIENCRFAGANDPIDSDDVSSITTISGFGKNYVYHSGHLSNLNISNNILCFSGSGSNDDPMMSSNSIFYFSRVYEILNIRNNKIFSITVPYSGYDGGSSYLIYIGNYQVTYKIGRFIDNEVKVYPVQPSGYYSEYGSVFPSIINFTSYVNELTEVQNFSYTCGDKIGSQEINKLQCGNIIGFNARGIGIFKNITINLPNCWKTTNDVVTITINSPDSYRSTIPYSKIENISITLADENGLGDKLTDSNIYTEENDKYAALKISAKSVNMNNIYIWNPYGVALNLWGSLNCDKIGGVVYIQDGTFLTINELTCYRKNALLIRSSSASATDQCNKSYAFVNKVIMNPTSSECVVACWRNDNSRFTSTRIYIEETNVSVRPSIDALIKNTDQYTTANGISLGCIVCPNNVEEGCFVAMSDNCYVDTWAVKREGSTSKASLKFVNLVGHTRNSLVLGYDPNKIVIKDNLTAGKHTATVYIAHKGFQKIEDKFYIEYHTANGSVNTLFEGALLDDNSTWQGLASGYTLQKIVCPLLTTKDGELSATLYFRGFSANELFVDPNIVIS